jgi:hypothetical protein
VTITLRYEPGHTDLYVSLTVAEGDGAGKIVSGTALVTPVVASWASYAIAVAEAVSGSGIYSFAFPAVAAGTYDLLYQQQAGGSPVATDLEIARDQVVWGGAAVLAPPAPGAYTQPTAAEFRRRTGLNEDVEGLTAAEFDAKVLLFFPDAEVRTALAVGEALFDSADLSARKAGALSLAVTYRAAHDYLMAIADEKVTGIEDPLLMEEASHLREQAAAFERQAEAYDLLLQGIAEGVERRRPVAAMLVAGVEPTSLSVSPVNRLRNLDERDGYPAGTRRYGRRWP